MSLAAEGDYEAMLLSCIDPRMVAPVYKYMDQRGLTGRYSQFVVAGAAIAVVAPKFETWRRLPDSRYMEFHLRTVLTSQPNAPLNTRALLP